MSREYCPRCDRPMVTCICDLFVTIANDIDVVILQHPSEQHQTKGSVALLANSLKRCNVIVGEKFDELLQDLADTYGDDLALLYPSEHAKAQDELSHNGKPALRCLVLLDGTWKKAYRLYMLNPRLSRIKHIQLNDEFESRYKARKTTKQHGLSTLEACCNALASIEQQPTRYNELLDKFSDFNQRLLSFADSQRQER